MRCYCNNFAKNKAMKSKLLNTYLTIVLCGTMMSISAQESSNTSGGNASGTGGTVSYSVGQVVYTTQSNTSGTIAQGIQHAYEIYLLSKREEYLNISLSVYPNPTSENLTLLVSNYANENLSYHLYDMHGKLIASDKISSVKTTIEMQYLTAATYFIHVSKEGKTIQTFKAIKTK
jgi:hypothetical protein